MLRRQVRPGKAAGVSLPASAHLAAMAAPEPSCAALRLPPRWLLRAQPVFLPLMTPLAVLALLFSLRRRVRHSRTLRLLRHVARDVRAKVKQMVALYQIATKIPDVFQAAMPTSVTQLLSVRVVFSLDVAGLGLPLGCLGLGTFQNARGAACSGPRCRQTPPRASRCGPGSS